MTIERREIKQEKGGMHAGMTKFSASHVFSLVPMLLRGNQE
jgi:hypothetical protein